MKSGSYDHLLKKENLKNTKHRKSVLEVMAASKAPMSPEQILSCLHERGVSISVSTVYRILEKLMEKGIVQKTGLTGDRKGLFEISQTEHKHHLVCIKCKKMLPIGECPFHAYESAISKKFQFDITGHKLELFGYCRDCKEGDGDSGLSSGQDKHGQKH